MASIQQYPIKSVALTDTLIGTKVPTISTGTPTTASFKVQDLVNLTLGSGTANKVPLWSTNTALGDSVIAQSGASIGIGNTSPGATLDVSGGVKIGNDAEALPDYTKAGTLRYRAEGLDVTGFSYVDICMQTGGDAGSVTGVYSWVNLKTKQMNAG